MSAVVAGLITVTLWGSAFVGIRDAGQALSPGSLALGRLLVSVAVLGVVAAVRREPLPRRRDLPGIAAFGVLFLGVYSVTLNAAERLVDAGTAAMLIDTGPIPGARSPSPVASSSDSPAPGRGPARGWAPRC